MPLTDMTLDELRSWTPTLSPPGDLAAFWSATLAEQDGHDLDVRATPVDTGLSTVEHHDVSFVGYGGARVAAWLVRPRGVEQDLPVVVQFEGYGGGRGLAVERLVWASAGYAHLFVDTRGQGSGWGAGGVTEDPEGSAPASPGFMTRGILDKATYYYRRVYVDAVRAVAAARTLPGVRADAVTLTGASQGGGISLAVASLVPDVAAVMADVPFLSHFRRAVQITDNDPYREVARYLSVHRGQEETVLSTLDYFDVAHLVPRATAPALLSVALMDDVCPPSTVWAAYRSYGGPVDLEVYPFNNHEGGGAHQLQRQLGWLAAQPAGAGRATVG